MFSLNSSRLRARPTLGFTRQAVAAIVLAGFAQAQTPPPSASLDVAAQAAERQQREQQDRQREQLRRARESAEPVPSVADAIPVPKVTAPAMARHDIRELKIHGADHMRPAFRQQLIKEFSGRSIGVEELERLMSEITRHYVARGFVTTRVYVPTQDLSTGLLRILVVEGKVERLETKGVASHVFPAAAGELLNLRDLEQGIDNLNRLPSHQATLDLLPGAEPGSSVVAIRDVRSRPWRLSYSADNTGSEATGRHSASATVGADDLLGFAEAVSVTHRRSVPYRSDRQSSESTNGSVSVPFGYQTFTLGGSMSSYAMMLETPAQLLPMDGANWSLFSRVDRTLYRGQKGRLGAYGTLTWKAGRNYLRGKPIGPTSRDATTVEVGVNYATPLAGGFGSVDASVARGLAIFGALEDGPAPRTVAPRNQFFAFKFNASWSRKFATGDLPWTFASALSGQWTDEVLFGSDQLTVGGLYAVRGFDRSNLSGDRGVVWRNDLSTTVPILKDAAGAAKLSARPYLGFDFGYAGSNYYEKTQPNPANPTQQIREFAGPSGSLIGAAAGLGLVRGALNADIFYARSLHRAGGMTPESGRTYLRFNGSF